MDEDSAVDAVVLDDEEVEGVFAGEVAVVLVIRRQLPAPTCGTGAV